MSNIKIPYTELSFLKKIKGDRSKNERAYMINLREHWPLGFTV